MIEAMNKKRYIKPQMEELLDAGMSLLAGSGMGTQTENYSPARQQDNTFADDDDDNDELF